VVRKYDGLIVALASMPASNEKSLSVSQKKGECGCALGLVTKKKRTGQRPGKKRDNGAHRLDWRFLGKKNRLLPSYSRRKEGEVFCQENNPELQGRIPSRREGKPRGVSSASLTWKGKKQFSFKYLTWEWGYSPWSNLKRKKGKEGGATSSN